MRPFAAQAGIALLIISSQLAAQRPMATIAARPDGKLFMVPVSVDGAQRWFTWDTGAPSLVIDRRFARELKLRILKADFTSGTGAGSVAMSHAQPVTVKVGTEQFVAGDPWIIDLSGVPISKEVRGLLGADLWTRYAVRMNSQAHTLELFRAGSYRPGRREFALPLMVKNNKMFIDMTLDVKPGLRRTERVRVDTGSEESVNDPLMGQARRVWRSINGNGLGANFESVSGQIDALHIGPFTIRNVWGPGGAGPAIGMELLRRFVVTFDAKARKMYLKPTAALTERVPPPSR